jgi:hypothetical protein
MDNANIKDVAEALRCKDWLGQGVDKPTLVLSVIAIIISLCSFLLEFLVFAPRRNAILPHISAIEEQQVKSTQQPQQSPVICVHPFGSTLYK